MNQRGTEARSTNVTLRRGFAILCTGVAVVAVCTVIVAWRNPWHYVYLMPFGRPSVVGLVLFAAPVLIGVAAWLVLRPPVGLVVAVGAALLSLVMGWNGFQFSTQASLYGAEPDWHTKVVAVSTGGEFEIVLLHYPAFLTGFDVLRIRSRDGLRSREADQDLACFATPFDPVGPEATFDTARFVSDYKVEVRTKAGKPWTTSFDPQTLLATSTLSRGCQ